MSVVTLEPVSLQGLDKSNLALRATCGLCRHLKRLPAPGHGNATCINLGAVSEAPACLKFSAEPSLLGQELFGVLPALRGLTATQLKVVAALALEEARRSTKANTKPYSMGSRVYFRPFGDNYLNNYRRGVVAAFEGSRVLIASATIRPYAPISDKPFYAVLARDALFTSIEFSKVAQRLIKAGKINDPRTAAKLTVKNVKGYTPPEVRTIDGLASDSAEFGVGGEDLDALIGLDAQN